MCRYEYAYAHALMCVRVCVPARVRVNVCVRARLCAFVYTCVHLLVSVLFELGLGLVELPPDRRLLRQHRPALRLLLLETVFVRLPPKNEGEASIVLVCRSISG